MSANSNIGRAASAYQIYQPLDERALLEHFDGVKRVGDGWSARCPAHDDRSPSLSIGRGDDVPWIFKCHAHDCALDDILAGAGLAHADVMPPRRDEPKRREVAHDYRDEHGQLRYQVVRFDPKDFRQRRPDGNGGWIWNLKNIERIPYRLDRLVDVTDIWIVEGEKDADRLAGHGFNSTCNAGGAGKWADSLTERLVKVGAQRGYIIPDHDQTGRDHAQQVARSCASHGLEVRILDLGLAAKGADVSDWLDAGHAADELRALAPAAPVWTEAMAEVIEFPTQPVEAPRGRHVRLTKASDIKMKRARWLWATQSVDGQNEDGRIPAGALSLIAGREGIGKSIAYTALVADATRGKLPGEHYGTPRDVIIAATEDAWEFTIVPRLVAAGADLDRVHRVDVVTAEGFDGDLILPRDIADLEASIREVNAALVVLDPIMSRLDGKLDSHRDGETRQALEPLAKIAGATGAAIVGLIHLNKSSSGDVLNSVMASKAFTAVARAVLYVMTDPNDEQTRLLGQAKNNLGKVDVTTLTFRIERHHVGDDDEGKPITAGKLVWTEPREQSIREAVAEAQQAGITTSTRTAIAEAGGWLRDYLTSVGGTCSSKDAKAEGRKAGHTQTAIERSSKAIGVVVEGKGFPRQTYWTLPVTSQHSED